MIDTFLSTVCVVVVGGGIKLYVHSPHDGLVRWVGIRLTPIVGVCCRLWSPQTILTVSTFFRLLVPWLLGSTSTCPTPQLPSTMQVSSDIDTFRGEGGRGGRDQAVLSITLSDQLLLLVVVVFSYSLVLPRLSEVLCLLVLWKKLD